MDPHRQYGVTPPLSTELPTPEQKRASEALLEELRRQGTFESPSETEKRGKVLESLQRIADAFVKRVAKEKMPNNPALIRDARARVFTYGSYRLGVYGPGSDIDTLVIAPKYVTREDYFKYFPSMLKAMAPAGAITDLTAVEDAFVPIIKFEFSDISIDLIFSKILATELPAEKDWGLRDSSLLRGLDEAELRSVNGTRVTDEILQLVPEETPFREALRAVKLWAQRRAVYANIMGFPGGVAWAMLVARVCQLYPKATSSVIVTKFFGIILRWPWPNPVLLKPIEDGPLPVRVWNPKLYKGDSFHLMPIITPAYPSMCATFNITRSSLTVIKRELQRASDISQMIIAGRKQWKDLFTKHTFFTSDFKYYISVISASTSKEAQKMWSGFVESKVRVLVQGLERHPSIALARPFNKGYERTHLCKNAEEVVQVQNGSMDFVVARKTEEVDIKVKPEELNGSAKTEEPNGIVKPEETNGIKAEEVNSKVKPEAVDGKVNMNDLPEVKRESSPANGIKYPIEVYTMTHYIGVELVEGAKSLDLSFQVDEFKNMCFSWEKYKNELSGVSSLSIQHVRNYGLPDDVFEPGEVKPTKPVRKKNPAAALANVKKRSASEEHAPPPKRQQQQPQTTQQPQQQQAANLTATAVAG